MRNLIDIIKNLSESKDSDTERSDRTTSGMAKSGDFSKADIEKILHNNGYEDTKSDGNKLKVLVQIPSGRKKEEFRVAILKEILGILKREIPLANPTYSADPKLSSIGVIVFDNSKVKVIVKDAGIQGDNSAGIANEIELASILQSVIDKYGSAKITFEDPRGKTLKIDNCTDVDVAGRSTAGRKKADVVLRSDDSNLPISIKKVSAEYWESADSMFGAKAKKIIEKLVREEKVKLEKIETRGDTPIYKLSKQIVVEPSEQEAMSTIFGSDINPEGGIVIQTFKPEHFKQEGNDVFVDAHAVIVNKNDIPESHAMLWLIRNASGRNSASLGYPGIRVSAVTSTRGLGTKGDKDVILVDADGNVIKDGLGREKREPSKKPKPSEKEIAQKSKDIALGRSSTKKDKKLPTGNVGRAKR